jgi:hypothetical protein
VYIAKNKSIKIPVLLYTKSDEAEKQALLDSGATECFIHPRMTREMNLPTYELKKPRNVRNVDGTTNRMGQITLGARLMIQCGDRIAIHQFLVADIDEDDIILGYPSFEAANPQIDWRNGQLEEEIILSVRSEWEQYPDNEEIWYHNRLAKATIAQQLAEQAMDKKE